MRAGTVRDKAALGLYTEVGAQAALKMVVVHDLTLGTVLNTDGDLVGGGGGKRQRLQRHAQHQQRRYDDLSGANHSASRHTPGGKDSMSYSLQLRHFVGL